MNKRFKITDFAKCANYSPYDFGALHSYWQFPTAFITRKDLFGSITSDAKILYCWLRNRLQISIKNERFLDENGYFIVVPQKEIASTFDVSERTVRNWMDSLKSIGLIRMENQYLGKPAKIYIGNIEKMVSLSAKTVDENLPDEDYFDTVSEDADSENDADSMKINSARCGTPFPPCAESSRRSYSDKERMIKKYTKKELYKKKGGTEIPSSECLTDTKPKKKNFVKPSIDEIKTYADEKGYYNFDAERFYDYYEANGWHCGKSPMKDWKAAVRNWMRNNSKWKNDYNSRYVDEDERESKETLHRQIAELEKAGYL